MPRRLRTPLGRAGLAASLLLLGIALWTRLHVADSASSMVAPEVRERLLREGRVRVIAEMRLPGGGHIPEGRLTGASLSVQQRDIAETRGQILGMDNTGGTANFIIERKTGTTGTYARIATTGTGMTTYTDLAVVAGTPYCYRVKASNALGDSGYSNEACKPPGK